MTAHAVPELADVLAEGNDAASAKIANLADPTDAQDAATKAYVDAGGGAAPWIEGVTFKAYLHSFGLISTPPICSPGGLYVTRVARRLRTVDGGGNLGLVNRSHSGYLMQDVASVALGDATQKLEAATRGLVLIDATENDLLHWASDAQGQKGYQNALRAFLALCRAGGTRIEETAFTFPSGTWTPSSGSFYSGGSNKISSSLGAQCSIAYTGTDAYLLLIGGHTIGGTVAVRVDGTLVATVTLAGQCQPSPSSLAYAFTPLVVPLLGMSAGAHTITVTKTDSDTSANGDIFVDALLPVAASPPLVVVVKQVKMRSADYTKFATQGLTGVSDATVDTFNGFIDTIAAEFPNVIVVDPADAGWDPDTDLVPTADTTFGHPNDRGMAVIAQAIVDALAIQTYADGLNTGLS